GVGDRLRGVGSELGTKGFTKAHSLGGNDVHQRTTLQTWEDSLIYLVNPLLLAQHEAAPRAAQCLVCRGCDKFGVGDWAAVLICRDEPCNVGHVDHEEGANLAAYLPKLAEINLPRVSTGSRDNELRPVLSGPLDNLIEIDPLIVPADTV